MMNFSDWLVCELTAAKAAVDLIPIAQRKGMRVGLFRQRARDIESARRLNAEYEVCRRHADDREPAGNQARLDVKA